MPTAPWMPERLAARLPFLDRRAALTAATRAFFTARGYREVETPCLVPAPGAEVHIRAFATSYDPHLGAGSPRALWLRTSPELAIKKLLAGGAGPVFELARVWRNGEHSARHAPEFTMLEWYRPGLSFDALMDEAEAYLRAVCPPVVEHDGVRTDLALPFERLTMADAFARHCNGLDILATEGDTARLHAAATAAGYPPRPDESWEDLFFRLLLERIEPAIGRARATFLTHWPAPQAALARRDPADPRAALRFELFAGGIELANAFDELTDATEQRARFHDANETRRAITGDHGWDIDEDFIAALSQGLPPTAGIALGFDRLAMLASGAPRIDDVLWLPLS
ncbi:EF-P lysine aminoacylase EpmA [Roseomonas sp. CECT 9278]|uniref:EF-P lysine aminoacylase EpmA n=1 Tax=Roseomonas sp. CECT 9278 TaxID=2845823 RepID=UPI001E32363A|nr:EF-P lysine aminoacylase EpmA [Roseomonas sp. CECT 9278]CAH0302027.1 Elongation factor P--(R)-beta-lysine ligase [Roseomonas sp. CECT 9278]